MRAHLTTVIFLVLLPACPSTTEPGTDTGGGLDAPAIDAPAIDAPAIDAPSGDDVGASDVSPTTDTAAVDAPVASDVPPLTDAPGACDDLAPAACLGAGCVPAFDDACCRECPPGPCADCTNLEYLACQPPAASACEELGLRPGAPAWACGGGAPSCAGANVVDVDSCDRVGCVPAYPSSMGEPNPEMASCVAIVADSCTVMCRRIAPPCPAGTVAEGDGSCYTDRCIPAFVCGR